MGLGCETPTSFMPAAARTAQVTTITPAFMGWGYKVTNMSKFSEKWYNFSHLLLKSIF